jgi:DNA polymerase elongation subunit (family B)
MQQYYDDRVKYKQMMVECQKSGDLENVAKYDTYQMARKISLNSAYGALGNEYFRYFDVKQAEAITTSGQLAIRWVEKYLNKYLNKILRTDDVDYVIASDTDSVYLTLDALVESHFSTITDKNKIVGALDRVCIDLIEPLIDECYEELADYLNVFQQKMIMKREVIADKGIWTAKKRYMLNVYDSEGVRYDEPKLKVMGIESVRSSTPSACRERLRESIELIMNESEDVVVDYIEDFKKEFSTLDSSEIAFPRAVRGLKKYHSSSDLYIKSTPIQVKGSLIYNNVLNKNGLSKVYPTINEGENIKFLYLKEPNPTYDKVIAFIDELPEEFGLNKYIDYDTQFNKGYLEPIKSILDVMGWEHERVSTLEGFFV